MRVLCGCADGGVGESCETGSDGGAGEAWGDSSTLIILPSGFGSKRKNWKTYIHDLSCFCACIRVVAELHSLPFVLDFLVFDESVAFSFPLGRFVTFLPLFSFPFALVLLSSSAPAKMGSSRELCQACTYTRD